MADSEVKPDFEKNLARLEQIVDRLEKGGLSLEESLKLFEEGQTLLKQCRETLGKAQVKVRKLLEDGGLEPFEVE